MQPIAIASLEAHPLCPKHFIAPLDIESEQRGRLSIHSKFHRAARYPFAASIELTDVQSERHLTARTTNLSLFGCYVHTSSPFPEGTKVSLRISHGGASVATFGKVVYSKPNSGMGIAFGELEPHSQAILEKWLASLRTE
ncbi:MAG: PilZ domain-containing protein [Candidatus Acidiferrales bacterium]